MDTSSLSDIALLDELASLHQSRNSTLRHGSDAALAAHTARTVELESEYLARYPEREIDPARTRAGAREGLHGPESRPVNARTGSEQSWDPVDFAVAEGQDPTPANVERARQILAEQGDAAIERIVP
jgi:hypothetical protein